MEPSGSKAIPQTRSSAGTFSCFYAPEDRAAGTPQTALNTARTEGRYEAEGWRYRKDGTRFWANVVIDPVKTDDGELIGFGKVTRDITERRNAQLALEKAQQALFQSQKMEAIGRLTGGVAHDFNNLLAGIIGSVEVAQRQLAEGGDVSRFLDNIMQAAERGATLTHRMLAFARQQTLELRAVDLTHLIRGIADLLQRTIGPGITIELRLPRACKPVRVDAAQLELAIMNIVVNARDAMPQGGTIVIATREEHVPPGPAILPGDYVCLSVTDTGEGMDAETLAKAPEPFFTTKGIGSGTGLGLSLVAGMAEQIGGKLILHSIKGAGTTAEIWLPVDAAQEDVPDTEADVCPSERTVQPITVLTVDDDGMILTNTAALLAGMGHNVLQAQSGSEALRILDRTPIDLLITDYAMPGMTGVELIGAAKAGWPKMPVLIVTGYASLAAESDESIPRLSKPFRSYDLAAAIEKVRSPA